MREEVERLYAVGAADCQPGSGDCRSDIEPGDVTNAEFMRTFMSTDFNGFQLLERCEAEAKKLRGTTVQKILQKEFLAKN